MGAFTSRTSESDGDPTFSAYGDARKRSDEGTSIPAPGSGGSLAVVAPDPRELLPLVGPSALELLSSVGEPRRSRVIEALAAIGETLTVLDGFDLAPYEMDESEDAGAHAWRELGPRTRELLDLIRSTDARVTTLLADVPEGTPVPDPEALLEDEFFGSEESSALRTPRTDRGAEFDRAMESFDIEDNETLSESVETLLGMLRPDFRSFNQVLAGPRVESDRWFLLGEIHDFKSACTQCLEAVVVTILNAFSPVSVAPILPRYRTSAARAVTLRTGIMDLTHDVTRFNEAIKQASPLEANILRSGLIGIVDGFARSGAYALLRPGDKKETILFRLALNAWAKDQIDLQRARLHAEDFARFLEVMRSINRREALIEFDRTKVSEAIEALQHGSRPEVVLDGLPAVYGRSDELDELLRMRRITGGKPDADRLRNVLDAILRSMMLG